MQDYEKLGVFYLGRRWDPKTRKTLGELLLYDSKDLTTHGVCVGMTGSGKTGLCIGLLEEAAIDGIPALAIDPKGDLANLALTFPSLAPADFLTWVDEEEAKKQGVTPQQLAEKTAATWKQGLADWDEDGARIARFREACEVTIYTPGSKAGRPLALLRAFTAPPQAVLDDDEALRARVQGAVSGLLALAGIDSDPMQGREHILLSQLVQRAWSAGQDLDLAGVIQGVQRPPFDKVGVLDLESFYPAKDCGGLALALNNVLASPGAAAWAEGEPLDIQKLLWTPAGKPRIAVLSIAHLSDAQRMFFVTTLLGEVLAWMRTQSGTSSLRALVYMDEIFGYFPPSAAPPSKLPMLTLLKQARAFGVGVLLATQNPVDLDYKGLANAGTWFIGRLQTEREQAAGARRTAGSDGRGEPRFRSAGDGPPPLGIGVPGVSPQQRPRGCAGGVPDTVDAVVPARPARQGTDQAAQRRTADRSGCGRVRGGRQGETTERWQGHQPTQARAAIRCLGLDLPGRTRLGRVELPAGRPLARPACTTSTRNPRLTRGTVALLASVDGTQVQWDEAQELPGDAGTRLGRRSFRGSKLRGDSCCTHQRRSMGRLEEVTRRGAVPVTSAEALPVRCAGRGLHAGRIARRVQGATHALGPRAA